MTTQNIESDNISNVDIDKEMREAYLQYSMSVIVGRALPDVRDGLKPVHRRILFAMHELGNRHDKPYKKSARVVGDVIGKYHPHGDTAVYDTMVRMAQDFSLRYPLVDGQGNFGSIDGDSPAAQRYTEVRMTRMAEGMLEDIEKETVAFGPNYDDSLQIPLVLPARFPNLLVNGSAGIAVGMATNIPPHNLSEVVDGCIALIEKPAISIDDLMKYIPGPDFPSAGVLTGRQGIVSAYKKGRGVITLRAVAEVEQNGNRQEIVITEIPYQVNKAKLIESIADLTRDKKIEGISDIRDESSREGMRIVITLKREENADVLLNRLFKFTQLQVSFGIIMLALDAKNQPVTFDLKSMLEAFVEHRREVITRRCLFDLKKAEEKAHILQGLKKALDHIDAVIATIKAAKETEEAKNKLIEKFELSEKQAVAILEMRLQRLTGLERQKILEELEELRKRIEWLKLVLGDMREINKILIEELKETKEGFGDARKTQILGDTEEIEDEDLITRQDMVVTITNTGYVKRIPADLYRTQKRGGKGVKGAETVQSDYYTDIFVVDTLTTLMVFTSKGRAYWVRVYRLPLGQRTSRGRSIANLVNLANGEKVTAILPVVEFDPSKYIVFITKFGTIKRTSLQAFSNPRPSGIIALSADLDDEVVSAKLSSGNDDIFIATKKGMSIRFDENGVRAMGRAAKGVKGVSLVKDDEVIGMEILKKNEKKTLLIVSENGYGKRTWDDEYRSQHRAGVGIITQKTSDKVGDVVATMAVDDTMGIMVTTTSGQVIRMKCSDISILGRNTMGVRLMRMKEGDLVTSVALVSDDELEESNTPEV